MRRKFGLALEMALSSASTPASGAGGAARTSDGLPAGAADAARDADKKATEAARKAESTRPADPKAAAQAALGAQADQNQQSQQSGASQGLAQAQQLKLRTADIDKEIEKLQVKIGSNPKPADVNRLNQLLTAKRSVDNRIATSVGLPPAQ